MSIHNLDKIFKPSSVAVIGASEKEGSVGHSLIKNIMEGGYQGKIFPVNPHYKFIKGLAAYSAVSDIDKATDLAVIATPIVKVPSIIKECVQAGVGGAIILSAGGKEIGLKGREKEKKIEREAGRGGLRIIGPNCAGIGSV